eukprot:690775-Rhodomonas_salina.1
MEQLLPTESQVTGSVSEYHIHVPTIILSHFWYCASGPASTDAVYAATSRSSRESRRRMPA